MDYGSENVFRLDRRTKLNDSGSLSTIQNEQSLSAQKHVCLVFYGDDGVQWGAYPYLSDRQ
ncbi:hypothetical protein D3C73_1659130 [compost metagenome]